MSEKCASCGDFLKSQWVNQYVKELGLEFKVHPECVCQDDSHVGYGGLRSRCMSGSCAVEFVMER